MIVYIGLHGDNCVYIYIYSVSGWLLNQACATDKVGIVFRMILILFFALYYIFQPMHNVHANGC